MATLNTQKQSDFSAHVLTFLEKRLLERLEAQLVLDRFATEKRLKKGEGDSVTWFRFDNPSGSTTPITDGVSPDGTNLGSNTVKKTADQYGEYTTLSDKLKLTVVTDMAEAATDIMAYSAALSRDTLARNELDANGTDNFANDNDGAGGNSSISNVESNQTIITSRDLWVIMKAFRTNNVPAFEDGNYRGVIHPLMEFDLLAETNSGSFMDRVANTQAEVQRQGEIGAIHGHRLFRSTNIRADSSSTNTYKNIFVGRDAYGSVSLEGGDMRMIMKGAGSGGTEDPLDQRSTIGYKAWWAFKVLQSSRVQILHAYNSG